MHTIFTYGTLKKGHKNHRFIEMGKLVGTGSISGYTMYNLGYFPAIIEGENKVFGELYEISEDILRSVDCLEAEGRLYKRVPVIVTVDDLQVEAETYVYINEERLKNMPVIDEWRNSD